MAALQRLLNPRSIAVIGGDSAAEVIRQARQIGFAGSIFAVNPKRDELAGIRCVASIAELPGLPDLSFVAAPPDATLDIVAALAERGAPAAICFAAGFAEVGTAGSDLQRQLRQVAGNMAVMGPNCHGMLNYLDGVAVWPDEHGGARCERGVALVTQSGNIAINLTNQQRGLDIAYVISGGNNSMLGMHDYINALLDDSRVSAIGLHIEGLDDVHAFSEAAIRALRQRVPIVALKAGRSQQGARITLSHTGSMAGEDRLYSALFERVGIARCETVSQFLETLKFLSIVGTLPDSSLGSVSCSGGDASIVADNAERLGVATPQLDEGSAARLRELLGPNVNIGNPLDYHLYIWGNQEKLAQCFGEVLGIGAACTLLVLDYPMSDNKLLASCKVAEQALLAAIENTGQRAVIVSSLPETMPASTRERLKQARIAPMQGIEDCVFAVRAAATIGAAQRRADTIRPVGINIEASGDAIVLDEYESKQQLRAAGVAIPEGCVCGPDETVAAAKKLGGAVVLKAVSSQLPHKSDVGAVFPGLEDESDIRAATYKLAALSDRILVEQMITEPVAELIVGVSRDPTFGLSLLIGAGGMLVELFEDVATVLLPVSRDDISAAIGSLKINALLNGYRGGEAADIEALVDTVVRIAAFAEQHADSLQELDVNPLLVTRHGAVAVDALIRWKGISR